ncbi:hypothetical protein B0T17DRAFT_616780 [Bombardia bombarda]|uniref:RGS domain-containing protein n=1 Tax=Bombardia bombarda TaxID=252184 RepID=A0AA39WZM1_9PEZI|nr:hypothetical protein B0T17DRAFT_616780 [Bombardia bombarda]
MILPRQPGAATSVGSEFGTTTNTVPKARLDGVGIWWLTYAGVWTFVLVCGMAYLHKKRDTPTLKIRGLPLTFSAIVLLHLYWLSVQIAYSVGPLAPEVAEYWIMGVWYPFGIALFHAGNSQFLHVAKAQSRFARPPSQMSLHYDEKRVPRKPSLFARLRKMEYSTKMFAIISIGMVVQLLVVVIIFMISRKFHPSFGIKGTEVVGTTPMEIAVEQGRGWEWWPSLVWQFLWAWFFAPYVLWQSRGIRDTHGWQLQTVACCIASLPSAPMWLIALYLPEMTPVNTYFVPPQWLALSVFVIEIFTIFVPCWQVRKFQHLHQETVASLANWELKKKVGSDTGSNNSGPPLSPTSTKIGNLISTTSESWKKLSSLERSPSDHGRGATEDSVLTMSALEHVLDKNPEPLRQFSARRDFSGENIGFLTAVAEWKSGAPPAFTRSGQNAAPDVVRQQFSKALHIYTEFISPRDAEFPINIAWTDLRKLEGIFERAARSMFGEHSCVDTATPFDEVDWSSPSRRTLESRGSEVNMVTRSPQVPEPVAAAADQEKTNSSETLVLPARDRNFLYQGDIPQGFNLSVFDVAQHDIKYLVLTNTWPKYVRERRNSEESTGTQKSGESYETSRSKRSLHMAFAFLKAAIE